jgi:tripartite-type tricarboxylate transporter receptor subunit TctC
VRALAVTTLKRLPQFPELPTVAESGYKGYQAGNWYGIVAPAKTPREIVTAVRTAAVTAMNDPAVNRRLVDLGYVIVGDQPDEFGAFIKSEITTLGKIIKQTGATAE